MNTGTIALVTGGASGIGAATARRLAAEGAAVVIADIDSSAGAALAAEVGGFFVHTDVTSLPANIAAVTQAVDHFGALDVAILNAGLGDPGGFPSVFDEQAYRRLVAVNQDGVVYGIHAVLGHMLPKGSGSIVVTASLSGIAQSPFTPLYAATKHAVVGLVRSLGPGLAPHGIRINALCPTFVETPMVRDAMPYLSGLGLGVLPADTAADAVQTILDDGRTGHAWPLTPHEEPAPLAFPALPSIMADPHQPIPESQP